MYPFALVENRLFIFDLTAYQDQGDHHQQQGEKDMIPNLDLPQHLMKKHRQVNQEALMSGVSEKQKLLEQNGKFKSGMPSNANILQHGPHIIRNTFRNTFRNTATNKLDIGPPYKQQIKKADPCKGNDDPFKNVKPDIFEPPASAPFESVNQYKVCIYNYDIVKEKMN